MDRGDDSLRRKLPEKIQHVNKLIFVKRYESAREQLDQLLEEPAFASELLVHLRRIELATKLQDVDVLRQRYMDVLRVDAQNVVARLALALADQHSEATDAGKSAAIFSDLLRETGHQAAAYYGIGFSMELLKNHDRAIFNYQECLKADPEWYPAAFGLSQIYYQTNNDKLGDYYFYLFEELAPYNVYGNFETHRRLALEFLAQRKYDDAEKAITILSEWWMENKKTIPAEIQIYELLMIARIAEERLDGERANYRKVQASVVANQLLLSESTTESVAYFVAKAFEEFGNFEMAFKFYKKIVSSKEGARPETVQKIGGQFLVMGEYQLAKEMFDEAYKIHPDNADIRFCQLVANLKIQRVDVEDYLIGRERMKQLLANPVDKVELLSILHSLYAKFKDDPDVHAGLAEVNVRLGNIDKAGSHFRRMFELDSQSRFSVLKFAGFELQFGNPERAHEVLTDIEKRQKFAGAELIELNWLKTNYYNRKGDYLRASHFLNHTIAHEPWNVAYLVQQAEILSQLAKIDPQLLAQDQVLEKLSRNDESELDWRDFDQRTTEIEGLHAFQLVYVREKIRFLFVENRDDYLRRLLSVAVKYDAAQCVYDFVRLLNTNFDSPSIYWALGMLFKELWQLETAGMWFEQILLYPDATNAQKARAYLELADCFTWRNTQLAKAIEYCKLALELGEKNSKKAYMVLAHAHLRSGQVRDAQNYLAGLEAGDDHEVVYLMGLLNYRNGAERQANLIWKPLITVRAENVRFHNIKQEIMKFYYDRQPYLRAH